MIGFHDRTFEVLANILSSWHLTYLLIDQACDFIDHCFIQQIKNMTLKFHQLLTLAYGMIGGAVFTKPTPYPLYVVG